MGERRTNDSTRDLLEEVDSGWFSAPPPRPDTPLPAPVFDPSLSELSPSAPNVAELDAGWAEDLALEKAPAERVQHVGRVEGTNPVRARTSKRLAADAFARSKQGHEERAAQKRDRKRSKAAEKRARQVARTEATQSKQKAKRARPERPVPSSRKEERKVDARVLLNADPASRKPSVGATLESIPAPRVPIPGQPHARAKATTSHSLKVLGVVLGVLIAGAIVLAALARH
jgi:hypothetical protein